jgi:hypothetical protein
MALLQPARASRPAARRERVTTPPRRASRIGLLPALASLLAGVALPSAAPASEATGPAAEASAPGRASGAVWFAIPVASFTPETRLGLGALGGVHFRMGPELETSDVQAVLTGTARQQALLDVTSQLFPSERLAVGSVLRSSILPDYFWGIGSHAPEGARESFTSRYIELQVSSEWFVVPHRLRTGPRVWFRRESIRELAPDGQLSSGAVSGVEDYAAPGFGWGATWDTRDNRFFPLRGAAVEAWYLLSPRLVADAPRFGRGALDARQFLPLGGKAVLGLAAHLELAHGEVPFTLLPRLGGEQYLRGYYQGRWRDHFMYSVQSEVRFPIVGRLGGVVFAGASDVAANASSLGLSTVRPAAGAGARFRLTDDGLNVRLDLGVGREGSNLYLGLGEAF